MNSYFINSANKEKIFLNNAELEIFPKKNCKNFFSKIWESKILLDKNYTQVNDIYEFILHELIKKLNEYHKKKYSKRFWEILLGYWLHHFISKYCEKFNSTNILLNYYKAENLTFYSMEYNKKNFIPLAFDDYSYFQYTHDLNSNCLKEVLEFLKFKNFVAIKETSNYEEITYIKKKISRKVKINIKDIIYRFFINKNLKKIKKVIYNTKLNFLETLKLNILFGQGFALFPTNLNIGDCYKIMNSTNVDLNFRKNNLFIEDSLKNFMLNKCIFYLPSIFLENFKEQEKFLDKLNLPTNPEIIFTSNGFQGSSIYGRYVAEKIEMGSKLVLSQHGGAYGQYINHFSSDYEKKIADKFLSWGWSGKKVTPLFMLKKIDKFDCKNKINILFEIRPHRLYPKRTEIIESQYQTYCYYEQCRNLIALLKGTKIDKFFYIKLSPKAYYFNEKKIFQNINNKIKFIERSSSMTNSRKKAALLIFSSISTGHLEAVASNYPFLILNVYPNIIKENCKEIFDEMYNLKILHYDANSLFNMLNEINDDVNGWWKTKPIQDFIKKYKNSFARYPQNNKLKVLKEQLTF